MKEILKCKICKCFYNLEGNLPLVIKCGHTFCKNCIHNKSKDTSCPLCGININFKIENVINALAEEIIKYFDDETKTLNIGKKDLGRKSNERLEKENSNSKERLFTTQNILNIPTNSLENNQILIEENKKYNLKNIISIDTKDIKISNSNSNSYRNCREREPNSSYDKEENYKINNIENEYCNHDNSLETIPLDDKTLNLFDQSFHEDFNEFISNKGEFNDLPNYNPNISKKIIKIPEIEITKIKTPIIRAYTSIPSSTGRIQKEFILKNLIEEINLNYTDINKRKKYENYILKASECEIFINNNTKIPVTYQISGDDFYLGYLERNKLSKGVIFYNNSDFYEGEFLNNKKEGYGVFIFKNGSKYEGEFRFNKQHGQGKLYQIDGEIYIGEWKEGKINGEGVRFHSNGDKYSGQYLNNIRNGTGTYLFSNGDYYEGDWSGGKATGKGKFIYSNGNVYEGEFLNNEICGKGIFTNVNGDIYKGNFKNGLIQSQGLFKSFKTGEYYQGEFINGKRTGYGNLYSQDGSIIYSGYWNKDVFIGKKNI